MNFLLAVLSASAHSVNSVALRVYQTRMQKSMADLRLYQGISLCLSALPYWALNGFSLALEPKGLLLVASSLGSFIGNGILMSLNTSMPASTLYPMVNGGIGVLVAVISCTVFKEKLTVLKLLAIITGVASIVFLNL